MKKILIRGLLILLIVGALFGYINCYCYGLQACTITVVNPVYRLQQAIFTRITTAIEYIQTKVNEK